MTALVLLAAPLLRSVAPALPAAPLTPVLLPGLAAVILLLADFAAVLEIALFDRVGFESAVPAAALVLLVCLLLAALLLSTAVLLAPLLATLLVLRPSALLPGDGRETNRFGSAWR